MAINRINPKNRVFEAGTPKIALYNQGGLNNRNMVSDRNHKVTRLYNTPKVFQEEEEAIPDTSVDTAPPSADPQEDFDWSGWAPALVAAGIAFVLSGSCYFFTGPEKLFQEDQQMNFVQYLIKAIINMGLVFVLALGANFIDNKTGKDPIGLAALAVGLSLFSMFGCFMGDMYCNCWSKENGTLGDLRNQLAGKNNMKYLGFSLLLSTVGIGYGISRAHFTNRLGN